MGAVSVRAKNHNTDGLEDQEDECHLQYGQPVRPVTGEEH